jgi:hypothetical protein
LSDLLDALKRQLTSGAEPYHTVILAVLIMAVAGLSLWASPVIAYKVASGQIYESVSSTISGWMGAIVGAGVEFYSASAAAQINRQAEQTEMWKRQLSGVLNDRFRPSVILQALSAGAVWHGEIYRLANIVESHRLPVRFPDLASTLLRPSEYFTEYALGVTERLNDTENKNDRAILRGALTLAEEEFSEAVSLTESLIPSESDIEIIEPGPPVIYTLYEEQEEELVRLSRKDGSSQLESASAIFDEMRTPDVPHMSANVLLLIAMCNQESRIQGGKDIFPPTNAAFAAGILPLLVVKDEEGLRSFLTHLYKLIYEGAGDKNLRFLKQNGGHLESEDCDIIWALKDLRNKHSLHDPEHGSESDIRKKYADLGATLHRLGLKGMPIAKEDFLTLQERILSQMSDFLLLLIDKMRAESGE